jgi:hypothetical protein
VNCISKQDNFYIQKRQTCNFSPSKDPPSKPIEETQVAATGAKQRTYADVAKTAVISSPSQRSTPPPVSVKSDQQRHLELALDEWRQRLARPDHSIKTSISTEPSTDAANEIVISAFFFNPRFVFENNSCGWFFSFQARMGEWLPLVSRHRSTHDLTQHLCNRIVNESSTNESRLECADPTNDKLRNRGASVSPSTPFDAFDDDKKFF